MLTTEQVRAYERDGFVLVDAVFTAEEVAALVCEIDRSTRTQQHRLNMPDAAGRSSKLALWSEVGQDLFGAVSTAERVVNKARQLLGEELYHWHSKIMLKEPRVGGAWEWHQDYGYWYNDGCLFPRMISCMLALDPATRQNGCLKVIPGSHLAGRIEHGRRAGQLGADSERVQALQKRRPLQFCEAAPGSVLFFHCNTLHCSEANCSDRPRRAFICCYNALSNAPENGNGLGRPEPIRCVSDALLKAAAALSPIPGT